MSFSKSKEFIIIPAMHHCKWHFAIVNSLLFASSFRWHGASLTEQHHTEYGNSGYGIYTSPISSIIFWNFQKNVFGKFRQKILVKIFWKLHIPANIGLSSRIYTSNECKNNIRLADEVSFQIYFEKIGEIKFQKIVSKFLDWTLQDFFLKWSKK